MKQKRHEYKFRLEAIVLAQVNRAKNSRTRLAPVRVTKPLTLVMTVLFLYLTVAVSGQSKPEQQLE